MLEISQNSQEKETMVQVFSYEFYYFFYFIVFLDFWYVTCFVRKPIRAIRFSVKYDVRFQDRSFDVELLNSVSVSKVISKLS